MKRRNFLRDIALGIAATLVPRILQPLTPEIIWGEELEEIPEWAEYYTTSDGEVRRLPIHSNMIFIGEIED